MSNNIYTTVYTKEKGKLEITMEGWIYLDRSKLTFHREDGPAIEYADGYKEYYINGKRHREDGPAIEDTDGYKEYYINGKQHREDGPAREWFNRDKEYYINDNFIEEEAFHLINNCKDKNELAIYLLSEDKGERELAIIRGKKLWVNHT